MLNATSLTAVSERLDEVPLADWGPNGARYVAILLWNDTGLRRIKASTRKVDWDNWNHMSSEFWDLFLGGCYQFPRDDFEFTDGVPLHDSPLSPLWSPSATEQIRDALRTRLKTVDVAQQGDVNAPLSIAVVAVRRFEDGIDFDWPSLRVGPIATTDLGTLVADYTSAHVDLSDEPLTGPYAVPGSYAYEAPPFPSALQGAKLVTKIVGAAHGL